MLILLAKCRIPDGRPLTLPPTCTMRARGNHYNYHATAQSAPATACSWTATAWGPPRDVTAVRARGTCSEPSDALRGRRRWLRGLRTLAHAACTPLSGTSYPPIWEHAGRRRLIIKQQPAAAASAPSLRGYNPGLQPRQQGWPRELSFAIWPRPI